MFAAIVVRLLPLLLIASQAGMAEQGHEHQPPEKLGKVSFLISCKPSVQKGFNQGVALLHSFSYAAAEQVFRNVASADPNCAMAHWGIAMTQFHQLWQPPIAAEAYPSAQSEIQAGIRLGTGTEYERKLLRAAGIMFQSADPASYTSRALQYEKAMEEVAAQNPHNLEAQVFYALALLGNAPPSDKTHARQKRAARLLEPLFRAAPDHPGIAHYLIHAYDNAELASRGLPAARHYSTIAPSVPHALHMPSHIFTRLGLWQDSIAANTAARNAARRTGEMAEELHCMDYLVYAYLQLGNEGEAAEVVSQLRTMHDLDLSDFKAAYAFTAIPVRYAVERGDWGAAAEMTVPEEARPESAANILWAQGIGFAHTGRASQARAAADALERVEQQLQTAGNTYWATQARIMKWEVMGWAAHAASKENEADTLLRRAADEEDSLEKLPATPGPILPAREQLGVLLAEQGHPELAVPEFKRALAESPGRKAAVTGLELAMQGARRE